MKTLLNAYLRRNGNRTALATIDGSDGYGGCNGQTFAGELERIDAHFLREVDVKHGDGRQGLCRSRRRGCWGLSAVVRQAIIRFNGRASPCTHGPPGGFDTAQPSDAGVGGSR